jgi:N-acylglucosamine 2-epimerase
MMQSSSTENLAGLYRRVLLEDVMPFWLQHGIDATHGGILTALDRDGSVLDSDKSIWFQGRAAWMFGTLYATVEQRQEWFDAAKSCIEFLRRHAEGPDGKLYFTVTREGHPLRMRRYVYSESFAAIANAVFARIGGEDRAARDAVRYFETYIKHSFGSESAAPKVDPATRPSKGLGPLMIGINTAQELRENMGDISILGATCTEWIDRWIAEIVCDFAKPELRALMETVTPDGGLIDHFDGRIINPGHSMEAAWFIMHEGRLRRDPARIELGLNILDWMWERGWDAEYGGLFYFRDVNNRPVQEYWHDMKFWWPHNEATIATLLAWKLTGEERWKNRHRLVHDWSFAHFPDPEFGEWFGYLHRDGSPSVQLKGNMWKGPFHLPRMLWYCLRLLEE